MNLSTGCCGVSITIQQYVYYIMLGSSIDGDARFSTGASLITFCVIFVAKQTHQLRFDIFFIHFVKKNSRFQNHKYAGIAKKLLNGRFLNIEINCSTVHFIAIVII